MLAPKSDNAQSNSTNTMELRNRIQRSNPQQIDYHRHFAAQHLLANNTKNDYQMYDIKGKKK